MAILSLALLPMAVAAPADAKSAAAVFPPWWSQAAAIRAADSAGDIVGVGAAPFVMIVRSEDAALPIRLRAVGAVAVVALSEGAWCGQW